MFDVLPEGLYEQLLDVALQRGLDKAAGVKSVLRKLDHEEAPKIYAQFVAQLLQGALRQIKPDKRIELLNRLIELLASEEGLDYLKVHQLLVAQKTVLLSLMPPAHEFPRPATPMHSSVLLTGQGGDPPLEHELRAEMASADRVDFLVSFIKWSGLRLLIPALEDLNKRRVPVRVLSTSYMGASDPEALEWLANQENIEVRVSYDTAGTRLHAKAYHFWRASGFSTAYIGSANVSHAAMTQGLEWTVKVTAQDMSHILERFRAEFQSYWESPAFEVFSESDFSRFRQVIHQIRTRDTKAPRFFADITPRPFQERILDALDAARENNCVRNLVVAATGTGKTVVAALDYRKQVVALHRKPRLLFVAHRKEILEQALDCFRAVLRDQNFGELLVNSERPNSWEHVFASIQSLNRRQPWQASSLGAEHFECVIVDEAHHGAASSYRPLFDSLRPKLLLGLTATPERMDGSSILPDFDDRITTEMRLPEALAEKLLCPFHYFGVTDNIDLSDDQYWRNGRYALGVIEQALIGRDTRAVERIDLILAALRRYQPNVDEVRGVGFCAGVRHAEFMAQYFCRAEIPAAVVVGDTPSDLRAQHLIDLREGRLRFIFTVDVLSEGVDIPEINLVMFLRPTESLTVFLQQLGRGLRHAPDKDCLTVLDFVGQTHRNYRMDQRFAALLMRHRQRLDREIQNDFPNLPPGCNIQLEPVAREYILEKVSSVLANMNVFVQETIRTWPHESQKPLTFGNFIEHTGLSAVSLLKRRSWSEWKAMAGYQKRCVDPDHALLHSMLPRLALRTDPELLKTFVEASAPGALEERFEPQQIALHYLRWGDNAHRLAIPNVAESLAKWENNPTLIADAREVAEWRLRQSIVPVRQLIELPFPCFLKLHACYGSAEIKAAVGLANFITPGPKGTGVLHVPDKRCYIHLITFNKDENSFSPTTRYRDYLVSSRKLHWESQSTITQASPTGQNYIHFKERGYTILFFARVERSVAGETAPFMYLGPAAELLQVGGDRPIQMVWQLRYPVPGILLEAALPVA